MNDGFFLSFFIIFFIMNIQEELWNAFNDIFFEEETHKYTDSKNTKYLSATGWVHQFSPEKDWDSIAAKKAKKTGENPEDLKAKWKASGDYAKTLGTAVHSVLENLWYKKNFNPDPKIFEQFPEMKEDFEYRKTVCKNLFNKMKNIYAPVANEFIVYDQDYGLCGTIDFLAWNMKKQCYSIIDWKTSKEFSTGNHFGNYLKDPFGHLEECNTAEYSLQLSLYKLLLEKHTSIRIGELVLFQIPGKTNPMPQVYNCMDLSEQIQNYLESKK